MPRKRRRAGVEGSSRGPASARIIRTRPRKPFAATAAPAMPNKDPRRQPSNQRRRKPGPTTIITSVPDCATAVERLSKYNRLAVDCEGVQLSRRGRLCLVQIASPESVYFFDITGAHPADPNAGKDLFEKGGLRSLLENNTIWKIMHDCRHDSDALFHQFNVKLGPVIDTQVVFSVLRKARGMPEGLPVSMRTLLKKFAGATEEELVMKNAVKGSMKGDDDFWMKRPLSDQAMQYARLDVEHLLHVSELLGKYIRSADKGGWDRVVSGSRNYVSVFRDNEDGPRKAQEQYEQLARVARRQRTAVEKEKRIKSYRHADPMRTFTFDHACVLQALVT